MRPAQAATIARLILHKLTQRGHINIPTSDAAQFSMHLFDSMPTASMTEWALNVTGLFLNLDNQRKSPHVQR